MPRPTYSPAVFVAESGEKFVFLADSPRDGQIAYSRDGETFYTLAITGTAGLHSKGNIFDKHSISNPHDDTSGALHRVRADADNVEMLVYNWSFYFRQDVEFDSSKLVPLPLTRRTEYLCQAEDDSTFVYISANKYNDFYDTWKLFVGDGKTMRLITVSNVERYRDGGTTYVETAEQAFFSPSPFNAENDPTLVPRWGDRKLVSLDPKDYDVVETADDQVTISKK